MEPTKTNAPKEHITNAKTVMQLKHKEGCTLKEAWAKFRETQPKNVENFVPESKAPETKKERYLKK